MKDLVYQNFLVEYMKIKETNLPHNPDEYVLLNMIDEKELLSWSSFTAKMVAIKLLKAFESDVELLRDADICPWCIRVSLFYTHMTDKDYPCEFCAYGDRHGNCKDNDNSDYALMVEHIKKISNTDSILTYVDWDTFNEQFVELVYKFRIEYENFLTEGNY